MTVQPSTSTPPAFDLTFPDEVTEFVRASYAKAGAILEYGSGGSTRLAAELGKPCLSVESDATWCRLLNKRLAKDHGARSSARAVHVNIGDTGKWGYPTDTQRWKHYWRYPLDVWKAADFHPPDLVLIDGRMRAACFAAVMMNTTKETCVLFDDYTERKLYQRVEEYVVPNRTIGRMAEFTVQPGMISLADVSNIIPWFSVLR